MHKKTINKKKLSKDCMSLDEAFIDWLDIRLKTYIKDASPVIDLSYRTYNYKGELLTQKEMIKKIQELIREIQPIRPWGDVYLAKLDEIAEIWKILLPAMHW